MRILTSDGLRDGAAVPGQRVVGVVVTIAVAASGEYVLNLTRVIQLLAGDNVRYRVSRVHDYWRRRPGRRQQLGEYFHLRSVGLEKFDGGSDGDAWIVLEQ